MPDPRQYRSDIPDAVVELLKSMMAKKPEDRLPSARAIGAEIEAILKPAPKTDRTPTVEAAPVQESAPPTPAPVAAEPTAPTPARTAPVTPGSMPPVTLPPRPSAQTRQKSKEPIIFMCYRREDTGEIAGRIHEQLVKTFGESSILRDVDRISDRTVSRLVLANDVVSHSDVMVIVIGRNWAGVGETPAGKPKGITNPKDPIRIQIEAALKQPGMLILPVLVDGATLPADLPPSLQPIAAAEPVVISDAALDGQMKKIVGRIRSQYNGLSPRRVRQLIAVVVFILLLIIAFVLVQNGAALPSIIPWLSASPL
ncbi:MAG: hypothetical protein IPK17_18355 [Chloroflexi bacterium]|uniref:hypothetical protein n=1 Tax=Candidatus Flexifilum breve TaxID=3140694 RepID=UPI003134A809|nr:hypothetical protein [Chloroflexota bacterium]